MPTITHGKPRHQDIASVCQRVREKSASYDWYNFSDQHNDFLKAFFDLAQEYDTLENFYRVCVAVPLEMMELESSLYLRAGKNNELQLVCDSGSGLHNEQNPAPAGPLPRVAAEPYELGDRYVLPVYSKPPGSATNGGNLLEEENEPWPGAGTIWGGSRILGMFAVGPLSALDESNRFFFVKYGNRIGYNLHNRLVAQQNVEHIKFINNLVMDIEHNVIVPNMYFRHLFNRLRRKIAELDALQRDIRGLCQLEPEPEPEPEPGRGLDCRQCADRCSSLLADLLSYHGEMVKHHANVSLFLESLFRREHFVRGRLVLRPKRCYIEREIIIPQLEHYASRMRTAGITVERPRNMIEEDFPILVDVGLLAQVYANLFSNAAKYSREVLDHSGRPRKIVAYGREVCHNCLAPGQRGIKFNVFSTGPHLPADEAQHLFEDGMRGANSQGIPGTGHGLSFIRHVIELHGGRVGYEATPEGNNFYFILPLPVTDLRLALPPSLL